MKLYIDNREKERAYRAEKYFKREDCSPLITTLNYGDFVFLEKDIAVAFEYKTVDDFLASINDNRVFNQALNQSNTFEYHFVIIVGTDSEMDKAIKKHGYYTKKYVGMETLNGAIASLVEFTSVIRAKNESWAFDLMKRVALKCVRDKPVVHRFNKSRGSPAYRLLVNNVNRIGSKTAEKICLELGLDSAESVFTLTIDDLVRVDGIGVKKAENILSQLKTNYS